MMGSSIDILSVGGFATLAIAANASYLNLPYFRYRSEIAKRAKESFKRFENISDPNLRGVKDYRLLKELSGMSGNSHPAGDDPGNTSPVVWDSEEGRKYLKTFHCHEDRRITSAALWMSGCYLSFSSFSSISTDSVIISTTSMYIFLVSVLIGLATYFSCDFSDSTRFFSVGRKANRKMLIPGAVFVVGLIGVFCGQPFMEYITPSVMTEDGWRIFYIFGVGKLSLVLSIFAMIAALYYPMNFIRLGNVIVDSAKTLIDECDAALSPFEDRAKEGIEDDLRRLKDQIDDNDARAT